MSAKASAIERRRSIYYAEDATWQVAWWREPHVGREAIGAVLDRQFSGRSDYRSEVLNLLSKDDVAFIALRSVLAAGTCGGS